MRDKGLTEKHYLSPVTAEHAIDNYYGDQEEFLKRTQVMDADDVEGSED